MGTRGRRRRFLWALVAGVLLGAPVWAQGKAPSLSGEDFGTEWVKPAVILVGPIFTDCGKGKLPIGGGATTRVGCPSALILVPGHYRPVPLKGWRLGGREKRHFLLFTYECLVHWVLGIIPLPISKECVGPTGMKKLEDYVFSWWAFPISWPEKTLADPWGPK